MKAMLALLAACIGTPPVALAQDLPSNIVHAELLPGWRMADGRQMAALRLRMASGWKTYWRAPGDAGIPPSFDWSGSENVRSVRIVWPRPQLFDLNGMTTIGYHDELTLPFEVTPERVGAPVHLAADVEMGVCKDVCVPVSLRVGADLAQSATPDSTIRAAMADQPEPADSAGVQGVRCTLDPIRDGLRLTAEIRMPPLGAGEFAVVETANRDVWVAEAASQRSGGALVAIADLVPPDARPFALNRQDVTITVFGDGGRVVQIDGCRG